MNFKNIQTPEGSVTNIEYVTENTLDNVVDWYKRELGEPTIEESSADKAKLGYRFDEPAGWVKIEISTNDYTKIEIEHVKTPH